MFKLFLRENRATIVFLIGCFFWLNLLLMLEVDFKAVALWYLNGTLLFFGILFLSYQYMKAAKQFAHMEVGDAENYLEAFAQYAEKAELEAIRVLRQKEARLEEDSDFQIAWVHEVKTPLTAMRLLLDQLPMNKTRQQLEVEWLRIHLLVDQSLHTLRLSHIAQDAHFSNVSLKRACVAEIREMQNWFMSKDLAIELEIDDEVIVTDEKWLRFIIRQLLSNAVKYSDISGVITIRYEKGQLSIVDEGIGIEENDVPRIFEKGFTGTSGRKQSASTGMGLFLAQQSAKALGMHLTATSKKGTTVSIHFPKRDTYTSTYVTKMSR